MFMKNFIKFALVFVLGLAIGFAISVYFARNYLVDYFAQNFAEHTVMDITNDIMFLQMYRENDKEISDRYFKVIEDGIPKHILTIEQNEEVKKTGFYKTLLTKAKIFYMCTKTPVPSEIEEILDKIELDAKDECASEE